MNSKLRDILDNAFDKATDEQFEIWQNPEGKGHEDLLSPIYQAKDKAEKAIRKAVAEDMLELVGSDQNTHWGACNNHGDKSNFKCVCPVEDRNALRAELRQEIKVYGGLK